MNHLQYETSPYLLQHAHNPVDWYAWKPEAFERAIQEQKPILVSIGYSTCHWCHVMERESFENEEIAAFMNANFINIKVDREERPDVDAIYMEACQILTGGGGWPLNCFLTPDSKPFYAGTYFPPEPAYNRPSWMQLLAYLADVWANKRSQAQDQAEKLMRNIQRNDGVFLQTITMDTDQEQTPALPDPAAIFNRIRGQFDLSEGGFGGAPKFPSSMAIQWLLQYDYLASSPDARQHALFSLEKMAQGGIYDQIGGGFARYATDREWLVPHFEKMLYDNALLVSAYSEAHKLEAQEAMQRGIPINRRWARIIEQTLAYVKREMTQEDGGFYAAQDADSEGVEGKFYVWNKLEIDQVLGADANLFCAFYGVTEAGNWEGHNILWQPYSLDAFARNHQMDPEVLELNLRVSAEKLLKIRSERVWPGLDNKILLGWNALMVSAYVAAYNALGHPEYKQAAIKNLDFLQENFHPAAQPGTPWRHSSAQAYAFLEDYAYLIAAWIEVYQISFDSKYLQLAGACTDYVLEHFFEADSGMFLFTDKDQRDILFRKKDLYDNATPSGNSTMVLNLQRLGIYLDRPEWRAIASKMLLAMRETLGKYPLSFQRWASALLNEVYPLHEIAIVGENAFEKAQEIQKRHFPNKILAASLHPDDTQPLLAGKPGGKESWIYVCQNFACQRPVLTLEEF